MRSALAHVSTVLFDVGNTLHHLDHALIADTLGRHGHPVPAARVARAECVAKQAVDAWLRALQPSTDGTRRLSYFDVIR